MNKVTKENNFINRFLTKQFGKPVHMAFECDTFNKSSDYGKCSRLFGVDLNYRGKDDHSPMLTLELEVFGWVIVDVCIYNVNHDPVEEYVPKCEDCKDYGTRHGLTHQCGLTGSGLGTDTSGEASRCSDFRRYYEAPRVSRVEVDTSDYPRDQADAPYKIEGSN